MSVLVKGMDMPENCEQCVLQSDAGFCLAMPKNFCGYTETDKRADFCPLIALPDHHGRLVDADAFKADYGMKDDCADCEKEMRGKVKACEYDRIYSKMDFCGWLDDAYTIVKAEGENADHN